MPSKTIEDFAYQIKDYMRSAEVVEGKNKLKDNGIIDGANIWTKNANLTYTANGSAGTTETDVIYDISYLSGHYVFSGCPSGGSASTYDVFAWDYTTGTRIPDFDGNPSESDYGTGGIEIDIPAGHNTALRLRIRANQTVSNLVFAPMICTKEEWNVSHAYEPYYVPVKDRVDELENVEDVTSKVTFSNNVVWNSASNGWNSIYRCGKVVFGNIRFTTPNTVSDDLTVLTVPDELMPVMPRLLLGNLIESGNYWSGDNCGTITYIGNDNNFGLGYRGWKANKEVCCSFCYLTK